MSNSIIEAQQEFYQHRDCEKEIGRTGFKNFTWFVPGNDELAVKMNHVSKRVFWDEKVQDEQSFLQPRKKQKGSDHPWPSPLKRGIRNHTNPRTLK